MKFELCKASRRETVFSIHVDSPSLHFGFIASVLLRDNSVCSSYGSKLAKLGRHPIVLRIQFPFFFNFVQFNSFIHIFKSNTSKIWRVILIILSCYFYSQNHRLPCRSLIIVGKCTLPLINFLYITLYRIWSPLD